MHIIIQYIPHTGDTLNYNTKQALWGLGLVLIVSFSIILMEKKQLKQHYVNKH